MSLKDEQGQTCVHRAARRGHKDVLQFLCVARTADINSRDILQQTPLMLAVLLGSLECVQWMVVRDVINLLCPSDII